MTPGPSANFTGYFLAEVLRRWYLGDLKRQEQRAPTWALIFRRTASF